MYFEKSRQFTQRDGFTFKFKGSEILDNVEKLFWKFQEKEMEARDKASTLLKNPKISHDNKKLNAAKNDISKYGMLKEKCGVWAHEFRRKPDREFDLGLGDVSFFEIFPNKKVLVTIKEMNGNSVMMQEI